MTATSDMEKLSNVLSQASSLSYTPYSDMTRVVAPTPNDVGSSAMKVGSSVTRKANQTGMKKRRTWKKPEGMPKRPLSAYNLFFRHEREKLIHSGKPSISSDYFILDSHSYSKEKEQRPKKRRHRKTHGKIGFADMARNIAEKWKSLDPCDKIHFEARAAVEKRQYKKAIDEWNRSKARQTKPVVSPTTKACSDAPCDTMSSSEAAMPPTPQSDSIGVSETILSKNNVPMHGVANSTKSCDLSSPLPLEKSIGFIEPISVRNMDGFCGFNDSSISDSITSLMSSYLLENHGINPLQKFLGNPQPSSLKASDHSLHSWSSVDSKLQRMVAEEPIVPFSEIDSMVDDDFINFLTEFESE